MNRQGGLTVKQADILMALECASREVSVTELLEEIDQDAAVRGWVGSDREGMRQTLNALALRGLVARREYTRPRKASPKYRWRITDEGFEALGDWLELHYPEPPDD